MNVRVLDTNFRDVSILDFYESLLWTERYSECGDFEVYTPSDPSVFEDVKLDYYLVRNDTDRVMIVESISISTDVEDGSYVTITGRSLESILDRRIVWGLMTLSGNLQNAIKELLHACIISPADPVRKIENFIFEETDDPLITNLTIDAQYYGDNLYDVIASVCAERDIGFKIMLNSSNQFVFKLYAGVDRSYNQTEHTYVVFSPKFDNLLNSNYIEAKNNFKNVAWVAGEGEGYDKKNIGVDPDGATGLNRREMYVDASGVSSQVDENKTLTAAEYNAELDQRGKEELAKQADVKSFEGEAEATTMYRYGVDFFMGDILQIANEYGHESASRVVELVTSHDNNGLSVYPTFKTIQKGE